MKEKILETIERALANAGFKVIGGEQDSIIFRDVETDSDFRATVIEVVP